MLPLLLLTALAAVVAPSRAQGQRVPAPVNLTVEFLAAADAVAVDVAAPVFGWRPARDDPSFPPRSLRAVSQTAYRIQVVAADGVTPSESVMWDSGVVPSSASALVPYEGRGLDEDAVYGYVREASPLSAVACEVGKNVVVY